MLYNRNPSIFLTHLVWWRSWIEPSLLGAGGRKLCRVGAEVCVAFFGHVFERTFVLIKHQQLLGPEGGKTSQPLNQDNAFCVTGAGIRYPASPPSPCISTLFLPSHLLTLRQSRSCQAAQASKNKWWPPKCMVKAREVGRAGPPPRAASVTPHRCALFWWTVLITLQKAHRNTLGQNNRNRGEHHALPKYCFIIESH